MTETDPEAILDYYQGADGPTLMIQIYEGTHVSELKAIFLRLAQGEATRVSLRATGIVNMAGAVDDLVFLRIWNKEEPSRIVSKVRDSFSGSLFEFARHAEGWQECAELLDGFRGPGHQYLSRGLGDEALVMVSYREYLKKR